MKVAVHNLGCKVNAYESEHTINLFKDNGYEIVDCKDYADIYIINTCTVTNIADQKSRKAIRQSRTRNLNSIIVVMGCYSQINVETDVLSKYANIVIGSTKKSKILEIVEEYISNRKRVNLVEKDLTKASFDNMLIKDFNNKTRALIKVQDGCNNYCSYCIIPYTRGPVRSKNHGKVIKEANYLAENGYIEIVLTGINIGKYKSGNDYYLSNLIRDLSKIKKIKRIRISSIEITEITKEFLTELSTNEKLVDHLHISMQSGCNRILKLMNRKYNKEYFLNKVNEIRRVRPNISITTDVIVGFPTETKEEFDETLLFVKKLKLSGGHVFPYSKRDITPAAKMSGQILKANQHIRVKALIKVFDELENNYYKKFINKNLSIIGERYNEGFINGLTSNYIKVNVKVDKSYLKKEFLVKINLVDDKTVTGEIIKGE